MKTAERLAMRETRYMELLGKAEKFLAIAEGTMNENQFFPSTNIKRHEGNSADLNTLGYKLTIVFQYTEVGNDPYGWLLMDIRLPLPQGEEETLLRWYLDDLGNVRTKPDLTAHAQHSVSDKEFLSQVLDQVHSKLFAGETARTAPKA
jgi:hypothetical protein